MRSGQGKVRKRQEGECIERAMERNFESYCWRRQSELECCPEPEETFRVIMRGRHSGALL